MRHARQVKIRLYLGQDDDLLEWLDGLDPRLNRGEVIKEVLRRGIRAAQSAPVAESSAKVDEDALREIIVDIRRVVEAAVLDALAKAQIHIGQETQDEDQDDEVLDMLGDELLM